MAWTLAGVTIRPGDEGYQFAVDSHYAIQEILDATDDSVSWYGAGSKRETLRFMLFENDNGGTGAATLIAAAKANSDVALVSDQGAEGNVRILSFRGSRKLDNHNSMPVYSCSAELIEV